MTPEDQSTPDTTAGYCMEIHAKPDGSFMLVGPEPLADAEEQGAGGKSFPDLTAAVTALVRFVKANPVAQDANSQMQAGYEAG